MQNCTPGTISKFGLRLTTLGWLANYSGRLLDALARTDWEGAPTLANITACQQGGSRGAQVWGTTPDNVLITNFQITPGGKWNGWSTGSWMNAPQVYRIAAALQNNGCIEFWALTMNQVLVSISQTSPGGVWGGWS